MTKLFHFILIILFCFISCQQQSTTSITSDIKKTDFIYISNNTFKLNEDSIFIIMLNYVIEYRNINHEFVVSPCKYYENPDAYEYHTKAEIRHQLEGHFQLIKELGFNTIRLCFDRISCNEKGMYGYVADDTFFYIDTDYDKIIAGLKECLQIAAEKDIKIMLLIKPPIQNTSLEKFTIRLLNEFKNSPTLFAYDFMNEPLYFDDKANRTKKEAVKIVRKWKNMMSEFAPYQLFTIGFSEPIEVFEWDPFLLPVDFIQFHTYHPLRVPNEIYWYSKYMNKPWMIGETALPADNVSVSYEHQRQFMIDAFRYTVDCGACGFGWWEFQEIQNTHFEAQYSGLLNHQGVTQTNDGKYSIQGSLKPAALEIQKLKNYKKTAPEQAVNYYNMLGYTNFCIKGNVLDKKTKEPIEGAVIRGWNEDWSVGMNTFTNEKGEFTLYSNDECVHFEISAPGMSKTKFDTEIHYKPVSLKNTIVLDDKKLEYHMISYSPFLSDTNLTDNFRYPIFSFKGEKFIHYKYIAEMKNIYLINIK